MAVISDEDAAYLCGYLSVALPNNRPDRIDQILYDLYPNGGE